jgi:hypothetical protein
MLKTVKIILFCKFITCIKCVYSECANAMLTFTIYIYLKFNIMISLYMALHIMTTIPYHDICLITNTVEYAFFIFEKR